MTEHHLPDDLSQWPDDPHLLLGVSGDADRTALRRAYTRLLRRYKPEHSPEAFRRLREAYERALQWAEYREQFQISFGEEDESAAIEEHSHGENDAEDSATAQQDVTAASGTPSEQAGIQWPPSVSIPTPESSLTDIWRAVSADPQSAHRRMLEAQRRYPLEPDVYIRLYWLLKLHPQLDGKQGAAQWLIRGMQSVRSDGALRELYRREIEAQPDIARSSESKQLLQQADVDRLLNLAQWRWRAAARMSCWSTIPADLEMLRPRLARQEPATWLSLLLAAVDELAWARDAATVEHFGSYCDEIDRTDWVTIDQFDSLARFDLLRDLADAYRRAAYSVVVPASLLQLIPRAWNGSGWEFRNEAVRCLARHAENPDKLLDAFRRLDEISPALLSQLGLLLMQLEAGSMDTTDQWPEELLGEMLAELSIDCVFIQYARFRPKVYDFCRQNMVSPERVSQAVPLVSREPQWQQHLAELAQALLNDYPLQYACLTYRVLSA